MPHIVINHRVADVEAWLKHKAERAAAIASFGGTNVADHVATDGSNNVAVTADVQDVAAVEAAVASPPPALQDAMQRHGVIPPLTIHVEK
jgi:protein-L-isoaspartate O-methyltransferase